MGELVFLCSGKLGNALKEAKPKIAWADIAQKIRVKGLVLNLKRADQHALTAPHRFVQFRCGKVAFVQGAASLIGVGSNRTGAIPSRKWPRRTKSCSRRQ